MQTLVSAAGVHRTRTEAAHTLNMSTAIVTECQEPSFFDLDSCQLYMNQGEKTEQNPFFVGEKAHRNKQAYFYSTKKDSVLLFGTISVPEVYLLFGKGQC